MEYDRKQLKRTAKELVRTTQPKVWVTTLFYILLTTVAVQIVTALVPNPMTKIAATIQMYPDYVAENPEMVAAMLGAASGGMLLSLFVSVLTGLYQAVMSYGYTGYTMKVWRRESVAHTDIFAGFPVAGRVIGASIMVGIFTFLWGMLVALGYIALVFLAVSLSYELEVLAFIVLALAIILMVIGIVLISYRYCLTPYFVMSDPDLGVMEAITASKTAMRGNYKKRFALDLSFIGWSLLVALITWAVVFAGFMVIFWGTSTLGYWVSQYGMSTAALVELAGIPGALVLILGFLVSLPLNLWLTSYLRVSQAGFFEVVKSLPATQSRLERHIAGSNPYAYGGVPPIPPAPPEPPEEKEPEDTVILPEPTTPEEPEGTETVIQDEPTDEKQN